MSSDLEIELPATKSALRSCLTTIEDSCAGWHVDRETSMRVLLVVEELFSNTIKYGYAGECPRPIRIALRCSPEIELVYEDEAPPFDPIAWLEARQAAPAPPDVIGGNGILLVLGMADRSRYERLSAGNRLTLRLGGRNPH